jgi:hypothetical protein
MVAYRRQQGMEKPPFVQGALFGAASFVVGYIVTLLLVVATEDSSDNLMEVVGFVYYNAQFTDVVASGGVSFNYVTGSGLMGASMELPSVVYHVVPILVLVAAGFLVAQQANAIEPVDGVKAGATLALGAVVLALLGTFLFKISQGGSSASPDLMTGVLLVGLAYPAIFGSLGGFLSTQL